MAEKQEYKLEAKPREVFGKQNKKLRRQGRLPGVLYGQGKDSKALELKLDEFEKIYREAGESTLVDLQVKGDKKPKKVLIHDVALHFMGQEPIHVDFYEVDLTKKISAPVPLHFVGESQAVKEEGGTLIRNITEVEVEALPTDLPQAIEVDITSLMIFEDILRIKDLRVSGDVKILEDEEEVVALVQEPRSEEELEALEETVPSEEEAEAIEELTEEEVEEGEEAAEDEEGEEGEKAPEEDEEEVSDKEE